LSGGFPSSREKRLRDVASEVVVCTKCGLWRSRKNAVPGEGSAQAKIVFIGEAPGSSEDIEGRPFVGAAGKFLGTLLSEIGLSREDVFICNVVKCRPPRNRVPKPLEVETCTTYLERQIKIIKPEFLVTLGNCSTSYIFSRAHLPFFGITSVHGQFHEVSLGEARLRLFSTFHPAAALYNLKYRDQIISDFGNLKKGL
jgi:uracil-DNA glycosylase family 4